MNVPHRQLGSTDLFVSTLGLGTVKFGRNTDVKYPNSFDLPSDKAILELLALAKDHNINLLDTAAAYGSSEQRLGELLSNRHDWIIVGKAGENYDNQVSSYDFSPNGLLTSIKRSLQRLKTDYIDVLLIHSDGNDEHIINDQEVFVTLDKAKKEGLIRYSGMSSKTVSGGLLTLQHADAAMVMCNPNYSDEVPVIEAAKKLNKGILIKKAFASGHVTTLAQHDPIQASLDYIFQYPGVTSVVMGTINPTHFLANIRCAISALQKP